MVFLFIEIKFPFTIFWMVFVVIIISTIIFFPCVSFRELLSNSILIFQLFLILIKAL